MWKRNVFRPYSVLTVILCGLIGANAFAVGEPAQTFTLDGQLLQAGNDDPLLDTNAKIVIQVLDPSKTCLLYEERQFVNTSSSDGYYNVQIGSNTGAAKRTANDPGRTMVQIFQNRAVITANSAPGETCAGGAYTPSAMDVRYFRLIVTPSATNIPDTLSPDTIMDSVANALVAQTIQGITPEQILQVGSGDLTQANLQTVFAAGNTAKLTSLLSVNPSNYVTKDSTNGTILVPSASTPGSPQAGQIWYDSGALKFWNGSAEQTLGISGSGVTSVVAGTGLNVGAGPGGTISSSGTLNINVGVTAGQIVQVQAGGKLPALNGSDVTNLNGSAVQSGTIGGTTAVSTSGNIQTTNDVTAERLFVYDNSGAGPGFVGFKAVADIAGSGGASYTLTLPNTAGGSGQVLRTDGTGILSWITPNVGTVTNVATGTGLSGGPISGSGTISLADTLVTPGNYGSATQVATFTVDQQGRLTAAGNTTISGVAPGGAASGDLSGSYPGPTVAKIQNITVSGSAPTAAGHVLRYNGTTQYIPGFLGIGDIRSTVGPGYAQFFPLNCTAGQTLTWNVVSDQMDCTNIGISDSQVTYGSKTQNTFLAAPNGSNGAPTFRTIAAADLPSISSGISGTLPIANGGTGQTSTASAFNALSPMTTLGDIIYGGASGAGTRLAGSTTAAKRFLTQTGDGINSAAPAWGAIAAGDIPTLNQNTTGTAANVTGTVAIANGGTGATTQQAAMNALAGGVTSAQFLRGNGTNVVMAAISASDVPTLNQNTTGTAANVTGTVAIANGGSGQTTQQAAINALTGTQTAGRYLRSDGTNATLSTIQAADVPTLNQNTTGTAANVTGTVAVANGGTGVTSLPGTFVLNGGQAGAVTLGPSDANSLTLNTSGSARMTILSGGNVGIGTVAPDSPLTVSTNTTGLQGPGVLTGTVLHLASADAAKTRIVIDSYGTAVNPGITGRASRGTAAAPSALSSGDTLMNLNSYGYGASAYGAGSSIMMNTTEAWTNAANGSNIIFNTVDNGTTGGSEKMRIDPTGKVGIGTTGPSEKLHVVGNLRVQGSTDCTLGNGAGATNCSSDIRLKDNVMPIENALDKILQINGVEFDWNSQSLKPGMHSIGVIAQDVQKVFPTAVVENASGYLAVDYAVLVSPLIQATKELNQKLEEENAKLKLELGAIKAWACAKDPSAPFCK